MNSRQQGAKVVAARKGAKIIAESISTVELAAAWVVESDEAWDLFSKYVKETAGMELDLEERKTTDKAIKAVDMTRQVICMNNGIDPGEPYPRKFK